MKLLFYNIFLCKNGKYTDYPIEKLMDDIITLSSKDRYKLLEKGPHKLNKLVSDDSKRSRNREMWFSKYRDIKPYAGDRDSDDMDELDRDILEPSTILLIPDSFLLVMEYNFVGASYKAFEDYINSFISNNNLPSQSNHDESSIKDVFEDTWQITLNPIKTKDQMDLIKNSQFINSIEIDYEVGDVNYLKLLNGDYQQKSLIVSVLQRNAEVTKLMDSKIATLVLKKGRFKSPLDMDVALTLFSNLTMEDPIIKAVRVEIKQPSGKPKTIDLKHDGKLSKDIEVDGSGFDYLRQKIRSEFYDGLGQPGGNNFKQFSPFGHVGYSQLLRKT